MRRWYPLVVGLLIGLVFALLVMRDAERDRWDNLSARYRAVCSRVVLNATQHLILLEQHPRAVGHDEATVVGLVSTLRECSPHPARVDATWKIAAPYHALSPDAMIKRELAKVLRQALTEVPTFPAWSGGNEWSWPGDQPPTAEGPQ